LDISVQRLEHWGLMIRLVFCRTNMRIDSVSEKSKKKWKSTSAATRPTKRFNTFSGMTEGSNEHRGLAP